MGMSNEEYNALTQRIPMTIKLESFEGPLDLLLYLIQSHEMDISKVSLSHITDQYLKYLKLMQDLNFDLASEFLVMAATLLLWKSRAILPQEDQENSDENAEDFGPSPEELIRRLLEHQRFLQMGEELGQLPRLHEDVFCRPNRKPPIERHWREMNVSDLALSLQDSMVRARKRKTVLRKETVSLSEKIHEFSERLQIGKPTSLKKLMSLSPSRNEQVVTFLASLELSRLKKLHLYQQETYAEIFLELIEKILGNDLKLALMEFEPEVSEAPLSDAQI